LPAACRWIRVASLLVALGPGAALAGPLTLRWTQPAGGPAVAEFRVYKGPTTDLGEPVWAGLPVPDAGGVYSADVEVDEIDLGLPVFVWVTAANASGESPPSNARGFNWVCDPVLDANCDGILDAHAGALTVDDLFAIEGDDAVFTVTLTGVTGAPVTVNYATQDGEARAGEDYVAGSGVLSLSGEPAQQQVRIATLQDSDVEEGESFSLRLSDASGAPIARAQGQAVILDDDLPPPAPPVGEPALQEVVSGSATDTSAVATSGPVAAGSDALYLAAISFKPNVNVASVSGLGLDWTPVRQQCAARAQTGIALFQASGSPSAGGAVTAQLASAPASAVISVARYAGAGGLGSVAAANTRGESGACSGGTDGSTYRLALATGAADSLVFAAAALRTRSHLPGAGYLELAEHSAGGGGDSSGVALVERAAGAPGTVSVDGSFSGTVDWAVVGVEILPGRVDMGPFELGVASTGGGTVAVDPLVGSFEHGATVMLWAVADPGFAFAGWSGDLAGEENPATLVMDSHKSVVARFARALSVVAFAGAGGSVALDPAGGVYAEGSTVTLTAVPDPGHRFAGWYGALSGLANPATLVVDSSKLVAGGFEELPPASGGVFTFTAVADAKVRSSSPTSSYDADTTLRVRGGDAQWRSFVRFDPSGLTGTIARATLRLWVTDGSNDGGTVFAVPSAWTEAGLTWQNAPALTGAPLAVAGAVAAGTWVEFDVTPAVTGDGARSFGLLSNLEASAYFSSREGAHPPELVVTTEGP
jgi:hypothetical protein